MERLPKDLLVKIALELDIFEVIALCKTSDRINRKVCQNPFYWRKLNHKKCNKYVERKLNRKMYNTYVEINTIKLYEDLEAFFDSILPIWDPELVKILADTTICDFIYFYEESRDMIIDAFRSNLKQFLKDTARSYNKETVIEYFLLIVDDLVSGVADAGLYINDVIEDSFDFSYAGDDFNEAHMELYSIYLEHITNILVKDISKLYDSNKLI